MVILHRGRAGEHTGHVLDGALADDYMTSLDAVRNALPIDTEKKRTAAARRFLCATDGLEWIRAGIVRAILDGLGSAGQAGEGEGEEDDGTTTTTMLSEDDVRILPWMRFLEYSAPGSGLGPHTDALIRCKDTGDWSTHTLLVFCSDCDAGGETTLLSSEDPKMMRRRARDAEKARGVAEGLRSAIARIVDRADRADEGTATTAIVEEEDAARRLGRLRSALEAAEARAVAATGGATTTSDKKCFPVRPRRGRIFFFPHGCPHEGRPTVSVPKVFLRAELILAPPRARAAEGM